MNWKTSLKRIVLAPIALVNLVGVKLAHLMGRLLAAVGIGYGKTMQTQATATKRRTYTELPVLG